MSRAPASEAVRQTLAALDRYERALDRMLCERLPSELYAVQCDAFDAIRTHVRLVPELSSGWVALLIGRFELVWLLWNAQGGGADEHELLQARRGHAAAIESLRRRAWHLLRES